MKLFKDCSLFIALLVTGVLLPFQAYASPAPIGVPEPVSLALFAVGSAGVVATAWIRRRKDK